MRLFIIVPAVVIVLASALLTQAQNAPSAQPTVSASDFWGAWPQGADPKELGVRVAQNLLKRPTISAAPYGVIYPETCAGYGCIRFAGTIQDQQLLADLITRYQGMLNPPGGHAPRAGPPTTQGARRGFGRGAGSRASTGPSTRAFARGGRGPAGVDPKTATALTMVPVADHVDRSVFGILPLEIYLQTKDERYLPIGKKSADDQWVNPRPDGLTNQTRFWVDDMFMVIGLQTNAYRATHDPIYLDHAATQVSAYLDKLQQPNGLFFHADDAHFFWGRGNGWFAVGMAELLMELPADHPQRAHIMEGYKKMMAGLLKYQAPSGMWRELIDNDQAWDESTGTGMFTFALATGVRKGWLEGPEYKEAAKKAWTAMASHLDAEANVTDCCEGTNKGYTVDYYLTRRKLVGDLHGQAAFIWAAWAMTE